MVTMAVLALIGGTLLGKRFNVWALLVCLGPTVVLTTATMSLASHSFISTLIATSVVITSADIGYLAGAYAAQAGMLRRALGQASVAIDR
jgi:hypothetical protein